jgi:4-oxalocrotonate tautomerase
MPLVRIDILEGRTEREVRSISDAVHDAIVATIGIPPEDRFHVIAERSPGRLVYDSAYLSIPRTDGIVVLQVTISAGRTIEQKKALYAAIARNLAERAGVRVEDVFVNLLEVPKENWSFGNGIAQYAP